MVVIPPLILHFHKSCVSFIMSLKYELFKFFWVFLYFSITLTVLQVSTSNHDIRMYKRKLVSDRRSENSDSYFNGDTLNSPSYAENRGFGNYNRRSKNEGRFENVDQNFRTMGSTSMGSYAGMNDRRGGYGLSSGTGNSAAQFSNMMSSRSRNGGSSAISLGATSNGYGSPMRI